MLQRTSLLEIDQIDQLYFFFFFFFVFIDFFFLKDSPNFKKLRRSDRAYYIFKNRIFIV